jgi:hypothetical protein
VLISQRIHLSQDFYLSIASEAPNQIQCRGVELPEHTISPQSVLILRFFPPLRNSSSGVHRKASGASCRLRYLRTSASPVGASLPSISFQIRHLVEFSQEFLSFIPPEWATSSSVLRFRESRTRVRRLGSFNRASILLAFALITFTSPQFPSLLHSYCSMISMRSCQFPASFRRGK